MRKEIHESLSKEIDNTVKEKVHEMLKMFYRERKAQADEEDSSDDSAY
jgi:hypothetical protein